MYNGYIMSKVKRYKVGARDWRRRLRPTSSAEYKRRLLSKIKIDKKTNCWLYQGAVLHASGGHGIFWFHGKNDKAHRVAYILFVGPVPEGKIICHKCPHGSVARCCNPEHLYPGTSKQNSLDMVREGRAATGRRNGKHTKPESTPRGIRSGPSLHPERYRGELNGFAKLTEADVLVIRAEYARGKTSQTALAKCFGVNQTLIGFIVRGVYWRHVGGPLVNRSGQQV